MLLLFSIILGFSGKIVDVVRRWIYLVNESGDFYFRMEFIFESLYFFNVGKFWVDNNISECNNNKIVIVVCNEKIFSCVVDYGVGGSMKIYVFFFIKE